ncbi:MAG: GNAT family N-acetyltransferase [Bacteroidia bacterium]
MQVNFNTTENYFLEDERVLLKPLEASDAEQLIPFVENEPDIWKYSLISVTTPEEMRHYLKLALDARKEQKEYAFAVIDKRSNRYAGSTRFYDIQLNASAVQLGYTWYGKEFQQTGLNRHCKYLLFQFAFETCGFERVELRADVRNEPSIAAMKKIGCVEEGRIRSHKWRPDGGRRDSVLLSVLKSEWTASVKKHLGGLIGK